MDAAAAAFDATTGEVLAFGEADFEDAYGEYYRRAGLGHVVAVFELAPNAAGEFGEDDWQYGDVFDGENHFADLGELGQEAERAHQERTAGLFPFSGGGLTYLAGTDTVHE